MDLVTVLIGLVIGGLGVAGIGYGSISLRRWRELGEQEPVAINQAVAVDGLVEIEGTVRPYDSSAESPLFGRECVAYEYKIEKRRRSSNKNSGSSWRTIDSGESRRPFVVEDETGTAYVDPDGASLSLEKERSRKTNAAGDPVPDDSTWNLNFSVNLPGMGGFGLNNKRYTEKRLDVDGQCYAAGSTRRPPAGIDADVVIDGEGVSTFLLSDATEDETRRRLLVRGSGYALGGLLALGIAVSIFGAGLL